MSKKEQTIEEYVLTASRKSELKKKHGNIFVIKVKKGDKTHVAVIKDPYEAENGIQLVSAAVAEKNVVDRNLFLLDNLWIEGSEAFKNDTRVRVTGAAEASQAIELLESEVEKI